MASTHASLLQLAEQGDWAGVLARVHSGVRVRTSNANQALTLAAQHGQLDCVRALISVTRPDHGDGLPFCVAASAGHLACVQELLPFSRYAISNALVHASSNGHHHCVRFLLEQPECNPDDNCGNALSSALFQAWSAQGIACVDLLWPRTCILPVIELWVQLGQWEGLDRMATWMSSEQRHALQARVPPYHQATMVNLTQRLRAEEEEALLRSIPSQAQARKSGPRL